MAPNSNSTTPIDSIDNENQISKSLRDFEKIGDACIGKQISEIKPKPQRNDSELGTYKFTLFPVMVILFAHFSGEYAFREFPVDPRVKDYFLMDYPLTAVLLAILYVVASTVWGPRYMKDRKPYEMKGFMLLYNAFQVVISFYMFYEVGVNGWFKDYSLRCQKCDFSVNPTTIRLVNVAHLYFMSKFLDLIDTFLFVARKKFNHVTNLHVIHHGSMIVCMQIGISHINTGHLTFLSFCNTFVHTVMYGYYLLAALGPWIQPYLWWKKYLTRLQLFQFAIVFIHTAQALIFPCDEVPQASLYMVMIFALMYFGLFTNFYVQSYIKNKQKRHDKKVENHKAPKETSANGFVGNSSAVKRNGFSMAQDVSALCVNN